MKAYQTQTRDALRAEVKAFLAETGMAKTTFGKKAVGNPNFYDRLLEQDDVLASSVDSVRHFMAMTRAEIAARNSGC